MKLETERLILGDFVADDWQRVLEYQADPLYLRYYEWTAADRTPETVQEFVGWFLDHQKQQPRFTFQLAVILKSDNLLIGNCGIRMDSPSGFQADIGTNRIPNTGTAATLSKPHMPSSTLASAP
ncbi:MAG TPA: GNAT family protein [Anaerolineales bacterium]|nr:GNAT family protein [Anaerolineales bacterium]